QQSAVKQYAVAQNLNVLQPEKLKNPDFIAQLQELKADLQIVVAFRMLPEIVWNMPPLGTINLHGSLLPQYRGAAPINWAVINGEKETGVTTFKLKHEIDTGNILLQDRFSIGPDETAGEVHDRMKIIGANLLVKTIQQLEQGSIKEQAQDEIIGTASIKHAPKIFTDTCKIDWHKSVTEIHNLIRGLSPYPGALTSLDGKVLKIFGSKKIADPVQDIPGTMQTDGKTYLRFSCADGYIDVLNLQLEGKKRMTTSEFLRGYRVK
ncbi:MAG: methionyl-tRNA formyltransferase, partial [Sediminibacterium sp.]